MAASQASTARATIAALLTSLLVATAAHAGLCGDTSGDGTFTIADALETLRLAVHDGYDRRGDVAPMPASGLGAGNGRITVADALITLRAAVTPPLIPVCQGAPSRVAVTTAAFDFSSAGFAVADVASQDFSFRSGALHRDSVIRVPAGRPIVVNRKRSNSLQLLDIEDDELPTIKQCSVADGNDSNSQDVAIVSANKGYVTRYAGSELIVIDPQVLSEPALDPACSTIITGHVDLSSFDDDNAPEMDQMVVVGDELFVSMQRLSTALLPKGECCTDGVCNPDPDCDTSETCENTVNGVIAVIDTATDTVTGSIELSFVNPFGATKGLVYDEFQKRIFVGGPGTIGTVLDDGAIEAVDPVTRQSAGVLLTGADIHANIFDFVIVGTARAFLLIADNCSNSVVEVDLASRSIRRTLVSSTAVISDIEMTETGHLWVAYRSQLDGDPTRIRIFPVSPLASGPALPEGQAIQLPQAPFTLAFLD